jgi:hypothetical protein
LTRRILTAQTQQILHESQAFPSMTLLASAAGGVEPFSQLAA